ncbi:MAG: hypothetical protein CMG71_08285 [Candidatus Marinimicrobia bacterium]|nr:hypothetical protein [Candidatus Neomarinimicrobiota bacterium]|tara:strand:+ start:697 stop:3819 length:3123 start_codon:yes stop_codon:yes gene_type:complete
MKELLPYWPTEEEIYRCIKNEAETASDAVLLSVHQKTPLSIRIAGDSAKTATTEDNLLNDFLEPDLPEGTKVLAITGVAGVGKSHMVRWLDAQLKRDARAQNMHLIRIPKSASLKSVVELILEPLKNNERFANARKELEDAVASVKPEDGAIRFAAELKLALREEAEALEGKIQSGADRTEVRHLKAKLDHAKRVPNYFSDEVLSRHFENEVLPRIVKRAIRGKDETEEDKFPQFSVEDLQLPDDINLGDAAVGVRKYYQTALNRGEKQEGYKVAVEVLNGVVDKAIRNLFRLNQAMGGVTLEDIILEIRKRLMEEGKELVLLIEDFANLPGIQEILLNVIIAQGVQTGEKILAPIRTAIAFTDGYLGNKDTVLSRAKKEWIVESALPSDEEVFTRSESLVSAYLNAARWGEAELIRQFELSRKDQTVGLTDWVEVYRDENETDEGAKLLKAFGTANDIPLFPYNKNALKELINEYLRVGGNLQFNPRRVIQYIIRDLLKLRKEFETGEFPPENFSGHSAKARIANWISSRRLGSNAERRLRQVVIYWGGNPDDPDSLSSINSDVFRAFNLPNLSDLGIDDTPSEPTTPETGGGEGPVPPPQPRPVPPPQPRPEQDAFVTEWEERLDSWVGGQELAHDSANNLRISIKSVLESAIDWNAARMQKVVLGRAMIEIPNARGNPRTEKKLVFSQKTKDEDGSLRRTLLAFLRFEKQGGTWDYPDADEDTALIANALDRLVPEYLNIVAEKASKDASILATALVRQGQVLGVAPKRVVGRPSIVEAVFSPTPGIADPHHRPDPPEQRWHELKVEAASERKPLQVLLASKIGAFQGTGDKVYAIDIARLSLRDDETLPRLAELTPVQRTHLSNLSKNKLRARSNPLVKNLSGLTTLIRNSLGKAFDKQNIVTELKRLVALAEEANVWPPDFSYGPQALQNLLEEFQHAPVSDTLEKLELIADAVSKENLDDTIHVLGKINTEETYRIREFISIFNSFMEGVEGEINSCEQKDEGGSIPELITENKSVLSELREIFSISSGSEGKS